jgi:uncharacterized protein (DUF2236 family)
VWAALARPTAPGSPAIGRSVWPLVRPQLGHFLRVSTAGLLAPTLRRRLGVGWTRANELEFRMLGSALRAATPLMPASLRNTGPGYLRWREEAIARGDVASPARLDGGRSSRAPSPARLRDM